MTIPLHVEYFNLTTEYKKQYGEKTIVFLQCGKFFEIYALKDMDGNFTGSSLKEIANICDLQVSDKKILYKNNNVMMGGIPLSSLEKYLNKILLQGWTVPIHEQDPNVNSIRTLSYIATPGTNFKEDSNKLTNNICCIWLDVSSIPSKHNKQLGIGISVIDIYTGKSYASEINCEYIHNPATFDDLERLITIHNPIETIIIHNIDDNYINDIQNFIGLNSDKIQIIPIKDNRDDVNNCEKQTYKNKIIQQYYPNNNTINDIFYGYDILLQSLCYLLNYLYKCNPSLVNNIDIPELEDISDRLVTANHSLKQLNIIDDNNFTGKLSSISNLLNNCITPMGKRLFNQDIVTPICDIDKLNNIYNTTEHIINNNEIFMSNRNNLREIKDINKVNRRIIMKKATPNELFNLYNSCKTFTYIYNSVILSDNALKKYILDTYNIDSNIINISNNILSELNNILDIDKCKNIKTDINLNIFKRGYSTELDKLEKKWLDNEDNLEAIRKYYNNKLLSKEKKGIRNPDELVKIHTTPLSGAYIQLTKTRSTKLKIAIDNILSEHVNIISSYDGNQREIKISSDNCIFEKYSNTAYNIITDDIKTISKQLTSNKNNVIDMVSLLYRDFLNKFSLFYDDINIISKAIAIIDKLINNAYIAINNKYCKPIIDNNHNKAFVDCKEIRHPLIEKLLFNETFVPNNISIGYDIDGRLIYGTNAVGKTSLIRSLGISVIMAQAGLFVPCTQFIFKPYKQIFTRILGNDNIFKGLSTFAVEMSELNTIIRLANKDSLVLGDELCSGTESDSAHAIFITGIDYLHNIKSSFVFATHFHEIVNKDEIVLLDKLKLNHMAVCYNNTTKLLEYDRILRDGPGDSMYGLEVCKSLSLPNDFIDKAMHIRLKYSKNKDILNMKTSKYNSKVIKGGLCEMCNNNPAVDIHHMLPQENADSNGFIGHIHKNAPANLMNICKKCHDVLTFNKTKQKRTKTTNGNIVQTL